MTVTMNELLVLAALGGGTSRPLPDACRVASVRSAPIMTLRQLLRLAFWASLPCPAPARRGARAARPAGAPHRCR